MDVSKFDNNTNRDDELVRLLTAHKRRLFAFIFALVHSIPDAEDVFQQTSLVMWEKFDDFEPGSDFVAWAMSIARFKAIDTVRRRHRDRMQFSSDLMDQLAEQADSQSERYEARAEALAACQDKLSARDQKTLQACYAHGITIKEAAVALGRPAGSVYDSLSRIRGVLLECIGRTLREECS